MSLWQEVWKRKGRITTLEDINLSDLLTIDGFDTKTGKLTEQAWRAYIAQFQERLAISPQMSICEVGCGAGALLYLLYEQGIQVAGVDYSDTSISVARLVMPKGEFYVAEANQLPMPSNSFDVVLSHSVFFYFSSLHYAAQALGEMYRITKDGGLMAVLDVSDLAKQETAETFRRGTLSPHEYKRLYADYPHLYVDKKWFIEIGEQLGGTVQIFDQTFPDYSNATYRFNVTIRKPSVD